MRILFALMLIIGGSIPSYAGNCQHSWETASDGSSCGDRSADSRPGGD